MPQVVLATKNQDKLRELRRLLGGTKIKVLSLAGFPECPDVKETGKTFEANAKLKARFYSKHVGGLLALADDSGLTVNALNGRPGVYSARFACPGARFAQRSTGTGPGCTYQDNNKKLLRLLKEVPLSKRGAKFVCVVALVKGRRCVGVVRGECRGRIAFSEKGRLGFGYDPVFIPKGSIRTFAEMAPHAKARVSHRGKAMRAAKRALLVYFRRAG